MCILLFYTAEHEKILFIPTCTGMLLDDFRKFLCAQILEKTEDGKQRKVWNNTSKISLTLAQGNKYYNRK